jgi:hypothetical protein
MPGTLQEFLATSTIKAAQELEEALMRLPEEKRVWQPEDKSRSALDQVAECAIMNDGTIDMIRTHLFPQDFAIEVYRQQIADLSADWPALQKKLHQSAERVAQEIRAVPDEDLSIVIEMPWGPLSFAEVISYPYWNMTYHLGQVNYIASMLNCLG